MVLNSLHRDVDKVHDMMDDIAEQQDVAREISEAISNPVAFGQDIDEVSLNILVLSVFWSLIDLIFVIQDELERELEELEQEELDNELLNVPAAASLPSVPTGEPAAAAKVPSRAPPARPSRKISSFNLYLRIIS